MYSYHKETMDQTSERYWLTGAESRLTFEQVSNLWENDEAFRDFFVNILTESSFECVRWETPPVNSANFDREFEFVLLDCPMLDREVDRMSFARSFEDSSAGNVAVFENLGNDALLLAPRPADNDAKFSHLNGFLKHASPEQVHELWQLVGKTFFERVQNQFPDPVWLNTAGMGVAWLHIRMDSYPKYYGFAPYRKWNQS